MSTRLTGRRPGTCVAPGSATHRSRCSSGTSPVAAHRTRTPSTAGGSCRGSSGVGRTRFCPRDGRPQEPRPGGICRTPRSAGPARSARGAERGAGGRAQSGSPVGFLAVEVMRSVAPRETRTAFPSHIRAKFLVVFESLSADGVPQATIGIIVVHTDYRLPSNDPAVASGAIRE